MGNESSKKSSSIRLNETPTDILKDDKFSEFENISHPSSPETTIEKSTQITMADELSNSGVLIDRPRKAIIDTESKSGMKSSVFSPPISNKNNHASGRRIIKATQPQPGEVAPATSLYAPIDDSLPHGGGKQHLPAVLSPKASTELLEESIEQSKSKRLEQLSRQQKNKREKLLDEKRRGTKSLGETSDDGSVKKKETPQPNPFSKFLRVFSVEPEYPHHKRAYEEGSLDQEEAIIAAATVNYKPLTTPQNGRHSPSVVVSSHNESKRQKLDESELQNNDRGLGESNGGTSTFQSLFGTLPEWVPAATAAATMAAIAVMVALKIHAVTTKSS